MDYEFIRYAYNSNTYQFIAHKSSIEDICLNTIIESKNTIFFEIVFSWKEAWENSSLKRTIEANSSDHHQ